MGGILKDEIKAVLFDHDDTLVRSIQSKWLQHKYIAHTFYNKTLSDEELHLHWGKPLTALLQALYDTDHIDIAMSYNVATRGQFPKVLSAGAIQVLQRLQQQGKKTGLVTATTRSSLENDFATLNIPSSLFHYIQTEEDTSFHKPDGRVFEPALVWLAEQHIAPHEVVYVGDSLHDDKAAVGAGFTFIGVCTGLVSLEEFLDHRVQAISQLAELFSF